MRLSRLRKKTARLPHTLRRRQTGQTPPGLKIRRPRVLVEGRACGHPRLPRCRVVKKEPGQQRCIVRCLLHCPLSSPDGTLREHIPSRFCERKISLEAVTGQSLRLQHALVPFCRALVTRAKNPSRKPRTGGVACRFYLSATTATLHMLPNEVELT